VRADLPPHLETAREKTRPALEPVVLLDPRHPCLGGIDRPSHRKQNQVSLRLFAIAVRATARTASSARMPRPLQAVSAQRHSPKPAAGRDERSSTSRTTSFY
jgi:hypothetical protein